MAPIHRPSLSLQAISMVPIHRAAEAGDLAGVKRAVGHDASLLHVPDDNGWLPLMFAADKGHLAVASYLIDQGARINQQSLGLEEFTALMQACHSGQRDMVRLLLERGADPTISTSSGITPLMCASDLEVRDDQKWGGLSLCGWVWTEVVGRG